MQNFSKKLRSKYTLYFLCFVALNLIEFLRNTQPGNIWSAAANCTGLVMMVIIFSQLPIREFLRPVNYIYTFVCIAAMGIIYWHWMHHAGEYYFGQMVTAVMNIWWLGLVVPYLFRKVIEEKKIPLRIGALGWTWILFTIWSVISVAGRWWPIWFLLMFGSFYFIRFSKEDKAALVDAMIDGIIASFMVIQGYAFLFRPYDIVRYSGAFDNCNMMSLYYLVVYCMVLFKIHLLHVRKAHVGWKIFYLLGAGVLLGFQFLTICRTAWLDAAVVTFCYGLVVLRRAWGYRIGKVIARGCLLVLVMLITFPVVFLSVRWLPTIHPHPIWYEGEWNEKRVHSWDPADSEKYIELDEFLEAVMGRFYEITEYWDARNPFLLHAYANPIYREEDVIPEPSHGTRVGRDVYFKVYWEHSTWLGHPKEDGHYFLEESKVYMWHGQNLWIQIEYYFGYPAGVLLAVLIVLTLRKARRKAKEVETDALAGIPFIICVAYFVFGITEVVWNPGQLILTLLFIVMHPQLTERAGEQAVSEQGVE